MAYSLKAFYFDLVQAAWLYPLATGAKTYTVQKCLLMCYSCFQPGRHIITKCSESDAIPTKDLILSHILYFSIERYEHLTE